MHFTYNGWLATVWTIARAFCNEIQNLATIGTTNCVKQIANKLLCSYIIFLLWFFKIPFTAKNFTCTLLLKVNPIEIHLTVNLQMKFGHSTSPPHIGINRLGSFCNQYTLGLCGYSPFVKCQQAPNNLDHFWFQWLAQTTHFYCHFVNSKIAIVCICAKTCIQMHCRKPTIVATFHCCIVMFFHTEHMKNCF